MSGIGLSRMLQGTVEGIDKGMARRDVNLQRERQDTQWEQGQTDREHSLTRQAISEGRADEQYEVQKKKQDRKDKGDEVIRNFMLKDDIDSVSNYFNEDSIYGETYKLELDPDGDYIATISYKGKETKKKLTKDQVGEGIIIRSMVDPASQFKEQQKLKRDTAAVSSERKHDLAKLEKEYELKRKQDKDKAGYDIDKEKVKAGIALKKDKNEGKVPEYEKQIRSAADTLYGSKLENGSWSFDSEIKKAKHGIHRDISKAHYLNDDSANPSVANADRETQRDIAEIEADARATVHDELDEGTIDKKDYETRLINVMNQYADLAIKKIAARSQQPAGNEDNLRQASEQLKTEVNGVSPEELKAIKQEFDDIFGPGSADNVLSGGVSDAGDKASSGYWLMRNANAAATTPETKKQEKPILSRGQRRQEGKKSQKAHRAIAVSEYKNEWQNMDDKAKLEWWSENASALKAASPRSHKKANKEVIEIRNQYKIGRPSRAAK